MEKDSALDGNPPTAEIGKSRMLQPNFDPAPTTVRIHRCGYVSPCKARGCPKHATLIAEKTDAAGCVWRIADSGEISNSPHTGPEKGRFGCERPI